MSIIKSHRDPEFGGKYLNELDDLIYIKQNINPSIKFEFYHLTEKEKDIKKRKNLNKITQLKFFIYFFFFQLIFLFFPMTRLFLL